jgi:hypothetical protein
MQIGPLNLPSTTCGMDWDVIGGQTLLYKDRTV